MWRGRWSLLFRVLQSHSTATALFAVAAFVLRKRALLWSRKLVLADSAHYDAVWKAITATPDAHRALDDLAGLVRELCSRLKAVSGGGTGYIAARQLNRRGVVKVLNGDVERKALMGVAGEVDPTQPVTSLDQLYSQVLWLHLMCMTRVDCARESRLEAAKDWPRFKLATFI